MKALVLKAPGELQLVEKEKPVLSKGEALVKIKAAALNKRDQFIRDGLYPNIKSGVVLGSDGSGVVEEVGDASGNAWLNKEVLINPNVNWGENEEVQSANYHILGMPSDGTFSDYVKVNYDRLYPKPKHLSFTQAAALPLAGLTAFRACFVKGKITAESTVLISGFGGGVAQFAFQFAHAANAKVFVTSGDDNKLAVAGQMGAVEGYNYRSDDWQKKLVKGHGGVDVVIDSAGGDQVNDLVKLLRPAGSYVFFGATNGLPTSIDLYRMFWNQLSLLGSTMGSDQDFEDMLNFVSANKIEPVIDSVRPIEEIKTAFDDMANNSKTGKIIIEL